MKTRTLILTSLGLLTAGMLGVVAFRSEPVAVDMTTASIGPMRVTVDVEGKTRIAEIYEVSAPIRGTARRAPVRVGDAVTGGETIVAIVEPAASDPLDPRSRVQAEAAVREAEAGLHMAESHLRQTGEELELAQSEYKRANELVARGVASLTRLESAEQMLGVREAAQAAANSALDMARGALDRARAALDPPAPLGQAGESCCVRILAPVDGRVLEIPTISARPVIAGTRLLSIGQPEDLEIVAEILSADAVRLDPGDRAIVERWGGPHPLEARIARIEPRAYTKVSALGIEEQRVDVIFDLLSPVEDRPGLGHGFSVYLRVVEWESDATMQVPLSALFRRGSDWAVFVNDGGNARLRKVEIGRANGRTVEVVNGLADGEEVLLHPGERIEDGTPIRRRAEGG
ncbi:efflux RND transporter periplasmic adaptor subunit [Lutimaribacter marinistellae]|uniref:Efflux RND transporter periplasmic adaptor subunit n=1 Tax=Lutimaribacter marinistellae TaxID=1820329 RepID=A0ABV7TI94_9RHOB